MNSKVTRVFQYISYGEKQVIHRITINHFYLNQKENYTYNQEHSLIIAIQPIILIFKLLTMSATDCVICVITFRRKFAYNHHTIEITNTVLNSTKHEDTLQISMVHETTG